MPASVLSPLNHQTFFKFWACKAFSQISEVKLSPADRKAARIAAVIFCVGTLGIGTLICSCLLDRKIVGKAQSLEFHKLLFEKIFSGNNYEMKKNAMEAFTNKCYRTTDEKLNLDLLKQDYEFLKSINSSANILEFAIRPLSHLPRELYNYIIAKSYEEALSDGTSQILHFVLYTPFSMELLLDCFNDYKNMIRIVFHSSVNIQDKFFNAQFKFTTFKEKYFEIKKIAEEEGRPNPFFNQNRLLPKAIAYEIFDALEYVPQVREQKMQEIHATIVQGNLRDPHGLCHLLAEHCKKEDIPYLVSYVLKSNNVDYNQTFFESLVLHHKNDWKAIEILINTYWQACVIEGAKFFDVVVANNTNTKYYGELKTTYRKLYKQLENSGASAAVFDVATILPFSNEVNQKILNDTSCIKSMVSFLLSSKTHYKQLAPLFSKTARLDILQMIKDIEEGKQNAKIKDLDKFKALVASEENAPRLSPGAWLGLRELFRIGAFFAIAKNKPLFISINAI